MVRMGSGRITLLKLKLNAAACRSSPLVLAPPNKTLGANEEDAFKDAAGSGTTPGSQCRVLEPEEGECNG